MPNPQDGPFLLPLALVGGQIDRAAQRRTDPDWLAAAAARGLVVGVGQGRCSDWSPGDTAAADGLFFLGIDDDHIPRFARPATEPEPDWLGLRDIAGTLPERDGTLLATAVALDNWHRTHSHCPRCGTPTVCDTAGWTRRCPADGSEHYPRTDPAVIMAVVDRDDRILLGNGVNWPPDRYSTLAGFVEPGESFEDAVRREVLEEVGIPVGSVQYLASQPWPFPASLMIGCVAQALATEIAIDPAEVSAARWFTRDELITGIRDQTVVFPRSSSISRRLIERWFGAPLPDGSGDQPG